jgi:hypothetical protein
VAHIRKLPNGRFEARYRAPDGRERSRRFVTKREAQAHLDQVGVDRRAGTWRDPRAGRIPLADWATQWESTTVHLRASSRARDESYLRNHVLPRFGAMRLDAIGVLDLRRWVADLSGAWRRRRYTRPTRPSARSCGAPSTPGCWPRRHAGGSSCLASSARRCGSWRP